jgi:hypothetical protein
MLSEHGVLLVVGICDRAITRLERVAFQSGGTDGTITAWLRLR